MSILDLRLFNGNQNLTNNPYTIDAIPTEYRDFTYRSKLEARFAAFFNALSLDFFYEPQRFRFENVVYIPDFKLFMPGGEIRWIEAKGPAMYPQARYKAKQLCLHTSKIVQVWCGDWANQIIYSFISSNGMVLEVKHEQLDSGFGFWSREELREAFKAGWKLE